MDVPEVLVSEHRESDRVLGTAAAHVTTAVPVTTPGTSVARVLADLRGQRFDSASIVAVIDEERLLGLVTIERLLAAPADADVLDVADREPPVVTPEADQEQAAWTTLRRGETGLAVVTADGTFTGLISPQQLLAILLAEHDEDLARLGGFLGSAATARAASEEPVSR
ncbi:MAG TPA: CBS domain-containing protein [Actinopolymorphaceae bacterium]